MKHISVRSAAIGWTMRMEERSCRVLEGREKFVLSLLGPVKAGSVSVMSKTKVAWSFG